jgi:hypothetical protein
VYITQHLISQKKPLGLVLGTSANGGKRVVSHNKHGSSALPYEHYEQAYLTQRSMIGLGDAEQSIRVDDTKMISPN